MASVVDIPLRWRSFLTLFFAVAVSALAVMFVEGMFIGVMLADNSYREQIQFGASIIFFVFVVGGIILMRFNVRRLRKLAAKLALAEETNGAEAEQGHTAPGLLGFGPEPALLISVHPGRFPVCGEDSQPVSGVGVLDLGGMTVHLLHDPARLTNLQARHILCVLAKALGEGTAVEH